MVGARFRDPNYLTESSPSRVRCAPQEDRASRYVVTGPPLSAPLSGSAVASEVAGLASVRALSRAPLWPLVPQGRRLQKRPPVSAPIPAV